MEAERTRGPELGRRTVILVGIVAAVALPAVVLRVTCERGSCEPPAAAASEPSYCSLPADVRSRIRAGFRDGRSPDVVAVTAAGSAVAGKGGLTMWPAIDATDSGEAPLVFSGTGVAPTHDDASPGLDDVAPTIADIVDLERPHPDVRSGEPIPGVASDERARLVVLVVWKGVGTGRGRTPVLDRLAQRGAGFTTEAGPFRSMRPRPRRQSEPAAFRDNTASSDASCGTTTGASCPRGAGSRRCR